VPFEPVGARAGPNAWCMTARRCRR
jgi:hypothetical protein